MGSCRARFSSRLYGELQDLLMSRMAWFIRNGASRASRLTPSSASTAMISPRSSGRSRNPVGGGARDVAEARTQILRRRACLQISPPRLAALQDLVAAPDIVIVAQRTGRPIAEIAATHFAVEAMFRLGLMEGEARGIPVADTYDRLALDRAIDGVATAHRNLTAEVAGRTIRPRSGRVVEHVAWLRSEPHPHCGRGHLCLRPYAFEAHRRGEPARGFGAGLRRVAGPSSP